jgi:hypothetical protein
MGSANPVGNAAFAPCGGLFADQHLQEVHVRQTVLLGTPQGRV